MGIFADVLVIGQFWMLHSPSQFHQLLQRPRVAVKMVWRTAKSPKPMVIPDAVG